MQSNYSPHQPRNTLAPRLPSLVLHRILHASASNSESGNITSLTATGVTLPTSNPSGTTAATTSVTSCTDRDSKFFKELTVLYALTPRSSSPSPESLIHSAEAGEVDGARILVDWQERPIPKSYSDDRERHKLRLAADFDPGILFQPIYRPFGKWSWVAGLPITEADGETLLSSGIMCSAYIKSGKIDDREISYVSKTWLTHEKWDGFYTELALYKVQLKPLQGVVVPTIINLYSSPGKVDVAMEPPHHSFWIEASADMPHVLKKRCIEAFEKIHAQGVCHGDVELRHMLIGGDGKVTIIDFQNSRALVPNETVNLGAATPADLRMEMRKVKFKLDYEGSRKWEDEKQIGCAQRSSKKREGRLRYSSTYGCIPMVEEPVEDRIDPAVESREWNLEWLQPWDPDPTRYVMPGQTPEALEQEVQHFLTIVDRMERDESLVVHPTLPSTPPSTPPPDDRGDSCAEALVQSEDHGIPPQGMDAEAGPSASMDSLRYSLCKRNAPDVSSDRPWKRVRANPRSPTPTDKCPNARASRKEQQKSPSNAHSPSLIPKKGGFQAKTSTGSKMAAPASKGEDSRFPFPSRTITDLPSQPPLYGETSGGPSAMTPKLGGSGLPSIKVRDFAYEHPLSTQRHYQPGLQHPEIMVLNPRWQDEDGQENLWRQRATTELAKKWKREHPDRKPSGPRVDVGGGTLRRVLEALVDSRVVEKGALVKEGDHQEKGKRIKRMRDESEDLDCYMTSDELLGLRKGPKILKTSGFDAHQAVNPRQTFTFRIRNMLMNPIRSVMRAAANFTPVEMTDDQNPTLNCPDDPMSLDELYDEHNLDVDTRDPDEGLPPQVASSNVASDATPKRTEHELASSSEKLRLTPEASVASHTLVEIVSGRILSGRGSLPKLSRRRSSRVHALQEHRIKGFVPHFTRVRTASQQEPPSLASRDEEEEVEAMLWPLDDPDTDHCPPSFPPLTVWIGG